MLRLGSKGVQMVFLALCVALGGADAAHGADTVYLLATGQQQGSIRGDATLPAFRDHIEVYEIHHLIRAESGTKEHEPLIFTKQIDRSSPNLYRAMDTNELLTLEFKYVRRSFEGQIEQFYNVRLISARIVGIEPITRNNLEPENLQLPHMERVRANYQRIEISHLPSGGGAILEPR